ncbi:carbohydrate ABC transporter permease [uncultured Amnibacterium sp.]|uniref:carbohydrate ABC transporter permease n=1 Tax=uncultured Amnibacterium sp. TaxID=1631851 RepID=UPI0035C9BF45
MTAFPVQQSAVGGSDSATRRSARRRRLVDALSGYALILPAGVFYLGFQLLPIVFAFVLSFFDWNGINLADARFTGFSNYVELAGDGSFWRAVGHNLLTVVLILLLQCLGSFILAAIITAGIRGGRFFQLVFFAPMVVSTVAMGMLAIFIFSPSQGLLNALLRAVGLGALAQPWLGSDTWALPTVVLTAVLQNFGLSVLMFISGLGQVNSEMLEAAEIDGASQATILWRVVFPVIRPVASVVFLLGIVSGFRLFDQVYVMTSGGPYHASDTIVTYLYSIAFSGNRVGYGNAIGVVLFLILLVFALVQLKLTRGGRAND